MPNKLQEPFNGQGRDNVVTSVPYYAKVNRFNPQKYDITKSST